MHTTAADMVATAATRVRVVDPGELELLVLFGGGRVVDVREADEVEQGIIPGAVHVPRGLLEFWADPAGPHHRPELDPASRTVLYCSAGSRSALAAVTLEELGYADVAHLAGGISAWRRAGLPVVRTKE